MARFTSVIRLWSDVALTTSSITIAVIIEQIARLAIGGSPSRGARSRSKARPKSWFSAVIERSRDIAEALQLLLDLFGRVGLLELRDFLLEGMSDELLDRRIAGKVGIPFHLCQQGLVKLDARA